MAKSNVSEWDIVADNNITINGININENCPPSAINNAIREMMAQIKMWKDGYTDPLTGLPVYQSLIVQNIDVKGVIKLDGSAGTDGQFLMSKGASATPTWTTLTVFVKGMIMLWSGSTDTIPSGWALCDGANGTPNLRDRFVVGAGNSYAVNATGGSANATLVSHSHTLSGTAAASSVSGTAAASSLSGTTGAGGGHNHSASTSVATKTGLTGTLTLKNRGGTSYNNSLMAASTGSVSRQTNGAGNYGEGWRGEGGSGSSKATFALDHNHSATTTNVAVGNHTHTFSGTVGASSISGTAAASSISGTAVATGSSATNANLPPYYALAYIMKL